MLRLDTGAKLGILYQLEGSLGVHYSTVGLQLASSQLTVQVQNLTTHQLLLYSSLLTLLKVTAPAVNRLEQKSSSKPLFSTTSLCKPAFSSILNILTGWAPGIATRCLLILLHQVVGAGRELAVQILLLALKTGTFFFRISFPIQNLCAIICGPIIF